MNSKFKILSIVSLFVLILSIFSVSCFAFENGQPFFLREEIVFSDVSEFIDSNDLTGAFSVNGVDYSSVTVQYMGYVRVSFVDSSSSTLTVYDSTGLTDDGLEVIVYGGTDALRNFFTAIERPDIVQPSFYDSLFDSISDGVFGDNAVLSSEQFLTLTLISTVLSYALILLPVLLVIGFVLRCFRL